MAGRDTEKSEGVGRSIEGAQNGMTQLQSIKPSSSRPFSLAFCIVRAIVYVYITT